MNVNMNAFPVGAGSFGEYPTMNHELSTMNNYSFHLPDFPTSGLPDFFRLSDFFTSS